MILIFWVVDGFVIYVRVSVRMVVLRMWWWGVEVLFVVVIFVWVWFI